MVQNQSSRRTATHAWSYHSEVQNATIVATAVNRSSTRRSVVRAGTRKPVV